MPVARPTSDRNKGWLKKKRSNAKTRGEEKKKEEKE